MQGDCSASGEGKPQPSPLRSAACTDEVREDVVQTAPDLLQPSALAAVPGSALFKRSTGILSQSCGRFNSLQCGSETHVCAVWCSPIRLSISLSPLRLHVPLGRCSGACSFLNAVRAHRLSGPCSGAWAAQLRGSMRLQWRCCFEVLLSALLVIPAPCCWKEDN